MNLNKLKDAEGLSREDAELVEECAWVLNHNAPKHDERRKYYEDKVELPDRGMKMPVQYRKLRWPTGWAAKSVNMLAERSVLDSFNVPDEAPDGFADDFEAAVKANKVLGKYDMAMPSNLIEGVGFWTVAYGGWGEPKATVRYNDAMSSGGVWDYKRDRVKACLVVTDYRRFGKSRIMHPCECVLYTDAANVVFTRHELNRWSAKESPHPYGRAMAVRMAYKPSGMKPFGKSRITPASMGYIDQMMQELRNMAIQSDIFSVPMKYFLGVSSDQYRELQKDLMDMYLSIFFGATINDAGTNPLVGMLQAADMTPHIAAMDKIAQLMAAETCLPVATFGMPGNGYTSSDALRASTDDLVMLARSVNRTNGECLQDVAAMVAAVLMNCGAAEAEAVGVVPHFADPAMPSDAMNADAQVKLAAAVPEYAGTEVFWERLGRPEEERRRIMAETRAKANSDALKAVLAGSGGADGAAR